MRRLDESDIYPTLGDLSGEADWTEGLDAEELANALRSTLHEGSEPPFQQEDSRSAPGAVRQPAVPGLCLRPVAIRSVNLCKHKAADCPIPRHSQPSSFQTSTSNYPASEVSSLLVGG
jgi:hypothetical protein